MSFRIRNILLIGIVLLILAWTIWPAMLVAVQKFEMRYGRV